MRLSSHHFGDDFHHDCTITRVPDADSSRQINSRTSILRRIVPRHESLDRFDEDTHHTPIPQGLSQPCFESRLSGSTFETQSHRVEYRLDLLWWIVCWRESCVREEAVPRRILGCDSVVSCYNCDSSILAILRGQSHRPRALPALSRTFSMISSRC